MAVTQFIREAIREVTVHANKHTVDCSAQLQPHPPTPPSLQVFTSGGVPLEGSGSVLELRPAGRLKQHPEARHKAAGGVGSGLKGEADRRQAGPYHAVALAQASMLLQSVPTCPPDPPTHTPESSRHLASYPSGGHHSPWNLSGS